MYEACYTANLGLVGFRCRATPQCKKVVRTYRGITMHLKRKHGLTAQMALVGWLDEKEKQSDTKPIRDERTKPASAARTVEARTE